MALLIEGMNWLLEPLIFRSQLSKIIP